MKKITSILMSMVLVFTLVSCGNEATKAKDLVTTFSETIQLGDVQKIAEAINAQALLDEYNGFVEASSEVVITDKLFSYLNELTFEVHDAVDNGDGTYSVDVDYTYVNAMGILEVAMNTYTDTVMNDFETYLNYTQEQFDELLMQAYAEAEATTEKQMISTTVTYTVEKVDNELAISAYTENFYDVLTAGFISLISGLSQ